MRNTILKCGGEVHFQTKATGIIVENDKALGIEAVDLKSGNDLVFKGPVILATGHSSRDIYEYLYKSGIEIEAKGLAVGVRLEHPAELIDQINIITRTDVENICLQRNIILSLRLMGVAFIHSVCVLVAL